MIRYFERVLGLQSIPNISALPATAGDERALPSQVIVAPEVALVNLGTLSWLPSLEEMALRLREAVAGEWLKVKGSGADVRWVSLEDAKGVRLLIAFGAGAEFRYESCPVVLAPSLEEMAGSPALKRSGWLTIQSALRGRA